MLGGLVVVTGVVVGVVEEAVLLVELPVGGQHGHKPGYLREGLLGFGGDGFVLQTQKKHSVERSHASFYLAKWLLALA